MWNLGLPAWELVVRGVVMYITFITLLRIMGKRQLGQFTVFDLVLLLLVANAVQPAITGPDNSLIGGIILTITFFGMDWLLNKLSLHSKFIRKLLEPPPTILAKSGRWNRKALASEGIEIEEAGAAIRKAGLKDVSETELVVLETDGTISVIAKNRQQKSNPKPKHNIGG